MLGSFWNPVISITWKTYFCLYHLINTTNVIVTEMWGFSSAVRWKPELLLNGMAVHGSEQKNHLLLGMGRAVVLPPGKKRRKMGHCGRLAWKVPRTLLPSRAHVPLLETRRYEHSLLEPEHRATGWLGVALATNIYTPSVPLSWPCHSPEHLTPASSSCLQLLCLQGAAAQSHRDDSLPLHRTSSSQMLPFPGPNAASLRASKADPQPSCRHTTAASARLQVSSHTVPQVPSCQTSTRPVHSLSPPLRRSFSLSERQQYLLLPHRCEGRSPRDSRGRWECWGTCAGGSGWTALWSHICSSRQWGNTGSGWASCYRPGW
jgi:hypothetical protein